MSWRDDLPPIPANRIRDAVRDQGALRVRRRRQLGAGLSLAVLLLAGLTAVAMQNGDHKPARIAAVDTNSSTPSASSTTSTSVGPTTTTVADGATGPCPVATGKRGRILLGTLSGTVRQLFSFNPEGTCKTQLTHGPDSNFGASWSPDAKRIAFVRDQVGLMVMNADGTGERLLFAEENNNQSSGAWTAWSPDGRRIAFAGRTDGMWLVDSTSGARTNLTGEQTDGPSWSPDGTRLTFGVWRGTAALDIVTERPDRSGRKVIGQGSMPKWGPDGRILFGQPIGEFQLVQEKLARMEVARLNVENLLFRYIEMLAHGRQPSLAEASAMKLYSSHAAVEVTLEAVQLFGGNGYMAEFQVEQLCRDAKVLQIYAGTDEIQVSQIARSLLAG